VGGEKEEIIERMSSFFGVYSSDTGKVYLIPVTVVPEIVAYLRLKKAKNNQEKGIIWAKDYEI
jgi:hypothetical protein